MIKIILIIILLNLALSFNVKFERLSKTPIITEKNSEFDYNYNAAYLPVNNFK
jgi:hypothetical protein